MSKKKVILIAGGLLLAAGAAVAVSAQGHRGHWRGGQGEFGAQFGEEAGMGGPGGMRGRFGQALTKDDYDGRTRERFARLDKNSDGVIDAAEIEATFASGMAARHKMRGDMSGQMGERVLTRFDTNKDGKVTKEEFQATVRKIFAEMDLNNDGKINDDDLPPMMRGRNVLAGEGGPGQGGPGHGGMGGMSGGGRGLPMMQMLRGADANKDGVITLDEALAVADKRFAILDRNKDGSIDKVDFDGMRKEMVDYRVKRFIHQFGADKDGRVTRAQFNAKAAERFAQMDVNSDGTIARNERPGGGRWFGGHGGGGRGRGDGGMMGPGGDSGQGPGGPGGPGGPRRGPGAN